jgi:regulator of ribonuclease activity A
MDACADHPRFALIFLTRNYAVSASPAGMVFATCDLCDAHKSDASGQFRVLPPVFFDFGGVAKFAGPAHTVKCFEDNSLVKAATDAPGHGRVLVVDGGGSVRRALVGGNLAAAAARNGWAGIVVFGAVRDIAELRAASVGVRALALMPMPTEKRNEGQADIPVQIAGVMVRPGDWVYADADGVVVADQAVHRIG